MRKKIQIAIDGPVGAGKSTVARIVARRLGFWYWDTGAMYRAVAYLVIKAGIDPEDEEEILMAFKRSNFKFLPGKGKGRFRVVLDGHEVTGKIRSEAVGEVVVRVAQLGKVRKYLVGLQKKLVWGKNVVMEGRDIGTRVLPRAKVKIFLTGLLEERVKRKYREIAKRDGKPDFKKLYSEIKRRDRSDRERKIDPLRKAEDAVEVKTTKLGIEGVVERILKIVKERRGEEVKGGNKN